MFFCLPTVGDVAVETKPLAGKHARFPKNSDTV